jgi:hypothetical protein
MATVDYYHGQSLEEIIEGDEGWDWAIRLNGGALIKNQDKRRTAVPEIPLGLGLLMTTYDQEQTTLVFGNVDPVSGDVSQEYRIVFNPMQYTITDPVYATEEIYPQRQSPEAEQALLDMIAPYPEERDPANHERPDEFQQEEDNERGQEEEF